MMVCETCGNLPVGHWPYPGYCTVCGQWYRARRPEDGLSRRLRDGFALLRAAEDEDIDPNEHIH